MFDEHEGETTLIPLFDRLAAGDTSAADEIIEHSMARLKLLAHKRLMSFPLVHKSHETDDIVQGASVRLYRALKGIAPASAGHFMRLAAIQIRRELLDLQRHLAGIRKGVVRVDGEQVEHQEQKTDDGKETELLREEFHEQVGNLPEEERAVFEMVYYQGLTHKDTAHALGVSESTVKRRWYDAQDHLHKLLKNDSCST
jgi:RNA polymerase sigma-70 factor (ECF subfamily)